MLTDNFNAVARWLLQSRGGSNTGVLQTVAVDGTVCYLAGCSNTSSWPYAATQSLALGTGAGISVGSGTRAPATGDKNLQTQITGGLAASVTPLQYIDEDDGAFCLSFTMLITNTGSQPVTISEIGYKQNLLTATTPTGSASNRVHLLDRTLLDEPVTIEAGDYATVKYTLKTAA